MISVIIYANSSFPGHSDSTPGYIIEDIAKYFNNASQLTEVNLGITKKYSLHYSQRKKGQLNYLVLNKKDLLSSVYY